MYYVLYLPTILFASYIHLLLYIDNTSLLILLVLCSCTLWEHTSHLFVFFLLDDSFVHMALVYTFSFYLVFYYISPFFALPYIGLLYFLYILSSLTLPIIQLILHLYFVLYTFLSLIFLLSYVHLDDVLVSLIYLLMLFLFHHIFLAIYILFFCVVYIFLLLLLLHVLLNIQLLIA